MGLPNDLIDDVLLKAFRGEAVDWKDAISAARGMLRSQAVSWDVFPPRILALEQMGDITHVSPGCYKAAPQEWVVWSSNTQKWTERWRCSTENDAVLKFEEVEAEGWRAVITRGDYPNVEAW